MRFREANGGGAALEALGSPSLSVTKETARRYLLGRQGLWPGRFFAGKAGTADALRLLGRVQVDPVSILAKSHDLTLFNRVEGYEPCFLDELLYRDRAFFDFGAHLDIYPMAALPYWRLHMTRRREEARIRTTLDQNPEVVAAVLDRIRKEGPLSSRAFSGKVVAGFRGHRDAGAILYVLWLTGVLMTSRRSGGDRVYDLLDRVAPPEYQSLPSALETERVMALEALRKAAFLPLRRWKDVFAYRVGRAVTPVEARTLVEGLVRSGAGTLVAIEGVKGSRLFPSDEVPVLLDVRHGRLPPAWRPLHPHDPPEARFLSPLDNLLDRDLLRDLWDFEYVWEIYKRKADVVYGRYVTPILVGDQLVGRLSPRFDRSTSTLVVEGIWTEDPQDLERGEVIRPIGRGLRRLQAFLGARRIDLGSVGASTLRDSL